MVNWRLAVCLLYDDVRRGTIIWDCGAWAGDGPLDRLLQAARDVCHGSGTKAQAAAAETPSVAIEILAQSQVSARARAPQLPAANEAWKSWMIVEKATHTNVKDLDKMRGAPPLGGLDGLRQPSMAGTIRSHWTWATYSYRRATGEEVGEAGCTETGRAAGDSRHPPTTRRGRPARGAKTSCL